MDEKQRRIEQSEISDAELEGIAGGAQSMEIARCARCGRGGAAAAMYALKGKKYCAACYRIELKG